MAQAKLVTNAETVVASLNATQRGLALSKAGPSLVPTLANAERKIKRNLSGPKLHVRSGALRASIAFTQPKVTGNKLVGFVGVLKEGPAMKYAAIHRTGGIIKPKKAKALAIPLDAAKTAAGVSRFRSPRQVEGLFMLKRQGKDPLLVKKKGKDGIEPWYVLKKSVRIPKRDYLQGITRFMRNDARKRFDTFVAGAIRG